MFGLLSLSLIGTSALHAQSNAEQDDEIFELNPFVVRDGVSVGYRVASILAGLIAFLPPRGVKRFRY